MSTGESDAIGPNQPDSSSQRETDVPHPQFVADAVVLFMVARDIVRIGRDYPDAMPEADRKEWLAEVTAHAEIMLESRGLDDIKTAMNLPELQGIDASVRFNGLMSFVLMAHPEMGAHGSRPADLQAAMRKAHNNCQETASAAAKTQMSRLRHLMVFSCRCPTGAGVKDFTEPARFLQMLTLYWRLARKLVQIQSDMEIGRHPHPHLQTIENIRDRLRTCFARLRDVEGATEAERSCDQLIEMLTEGDIGDLAAVPKWTQGELQNVERFIARATMKLSNHKYALTPPEAYFLQLCELRIVDYRRSLQADRKRVLSHVDAIAAKRTVSPTPAPTPPDNTPLRVTIDNLAEVSAVFTDGLKAVSATTPNSEPGPTQPDPKPADEVSKLNGWTRSELLEQTTKCKAPCSRSTFDNIRKAADIPPGERGGGGAKRRYSPVQLRKLITAAEGGTFRDGKEIAAAWGKLLPTRSSVNHN